MRLGHAICGNGLIVQELGRHMIQSRALDWIPYILKINGSSTECVKIVLQRNNHYKVVSLLFAFVHFLPIITNLIKH